MSKNHQQRTGPERKQIILSTLIIDNLINIDRKKSSLMIARSFYKKAIKKNKRKPIEKPPEIDLKKELSILERLIFDYNIDLGTGCHVKRELTKWKH